MYPTKIVNMYSIQINVVINNMKYLIEELIYLLIPKKSSRISTRKINQINKQKST